MICIKSKKEHAEVEAQQSNVGTVSLSSFFAVIYLIFLGQQLQLLYFKDSQRSLCICCSQARASNTDLKKRTAATASSALMKLRDFCPSCDSVRHQWEDQGNKITRIRGTIPPGTTQIELSTSDSCNELSGSVNEMLSFFSFF